MLFPKNAYSKTKQAPCWSYPLRNFEANYRRHVTRTEAASLLDDGKATWQCRRCGKSSDRGCSIGSAEHQFVLRMTEPECRYTKSPCAISPSEIEAVVGIAKGEIGLPSRMRLVEAARDKLAAWPFIGDTRTPRVGLRARQTKSASPHARDTPKPSSCGARTSRRRLGSSKRGKIG